MMEVDREAWWERTVEGTEFEGVTAVDLGFDSEDALYEFVTVAQWAELDKNGDGLLCMKDGPNTPGFPDYLFIGVDNNARKH